MDLAKCILLLTSRDFFLFFSCFTDGFCHFLRESSLLVIVCHCQELLKERCGQSCTDSRYFTVPEILGSGGIGFAIFFIFFHVLLIENEIKLSI